MDLASLCERAIVSIDRSATVRQAAALMREHHVGSVVITESQGDGHRVCGLLTDRDLAIEVMARGADGSLTRISQLAIGKPIGAPMRAGIDDAIALMQEHGVRRLFVHDEDGGLIGLITLDDVLRACADRLSALADALRKGIARESAERQPPAVLPRRPVLRVPPTGTAGWGSAQP